MTIASLIVDVAANTVKLQKDVEQIQGSLTKVSSVAGTVGKVLAGAFSVTAIVSAGKRVLDFAGQLTDLSAKTGISTTGLQKLQLAFEQSGVSLDTVTTNATKLSKALIGGDKAAVGALEKLGLSVADLKRMAPEQQFITVADAIGRIQNPTERAYAAMTIFGKGGAELLQGLDGHLQETTDKFEQMGLIIDEETVKAADDFGDQLGVMGQQLLGILAGALKPLLPALSALGEVLMQLASVVGPALGFAMKGVSLALMGVWAAVAELLAGLADLAQKVPLVGKHFGFLSGASEWLHNSAAKTSAQIERLALGTAKMGETSKMAAPAVLGLGGATDETAKKIAKINEQIAAATRDIGNLTRAQRDQIDTLDKLGISTGDIATKMRVSEAAVKQHLDTTHDITKATEKFSEVLSGLTNVAHGWQAMVEANDKAMAGWSGRVLEATHAADMFDGQLSGVMTPNIREQHESLDELSTAMEEWKDTLGSMSQAFAQLAQVSGKSFSAVAQWLGTTFSALELTSKGTDTFGKGLDQISAGNKAAGLANIAAGAASIAAAFMQATASSNKFLATLGGAMQGAQIGAQFGAMGAAIGAAIGGAAGLIRSLFGKSKGKLLGEQADKEIAQLQADLLKTYGSLDNIRTMAGGAGAELAAAWGDKNQAGLAHFSALLANFNAIVQENQQLADDTVTFMEDTFPAALKLVADSGALVSAEFLGVITQLDAMGAASEEINGFITGQITKAVGGLNAFVTNTAVTSQASADAMIGALMASFDELTTRGMSAGEAIKLMGPTIDALQDNLRKAGITGTTAWDSIRNMSVLARDAIAGPMIEAIAGIGDALAGLHNSGLLNEEMFSGLAQQVSDTFDKLVNQGFDGDAALAMIQPTLQRIWELQQDFGYEVDSSTQQLIDQALEAGKVGEAHRDAQEKATKAMQAAADAMTKVGEVLERVFGTAAGEGESFADRVKKAIDSIPRSIDIVVNGVYHGPPLPGAGVPEPDTPPGFAAGTQGRYLDFGAGTPAVLHGRERVMTEAEGRRDGATSQALLTEVSGLRRDFSRLPRLIRDAILTTP